MAELSASNQLAPVCMFVYNRLGCTRKTINALRRNTLAKDTNIFIFSDGGRDEKSWSLVYKLRKYLRKISGFKSVTVIERPTNYYLERNVIEGITEVVNKFGSVIVLEDDVVTGENYLSFMNLALNYYKDIKRVMHISAFCFVDMKDLGETVLWTYPEGFGWATWQDRWDKFNHYQSREKALFGLNDDALNQIELDGSFRCLNTLNFTPIPWDICWYINIIRNNGLCLTPTISLVKNIGLYSGTHFSGSRLLGKSFYETIASDVNITKMTPLIESNPDAMLRLKNFYTNAHFKFNYFGRIINKCASIWGRIKRCIISGLSK